MKNDNYFARLLRAILGRRESVPTEPPLTTPVERPASASTEELRARVASLELDLKSRDEMIERMRREYANLEAARDRATTAGGQELLEKLLRKLCGPMSNLAVLSEAARAGKDVAVGDMAALVADLEKQLAAVGMQIIGQPGETSEFNVALHQRMSGGDVHAGTPVVVRIPGYKLGEKVLQKALVTAKEQP
jgi:molecular chaperone GrpE (heat shock protein)